MCLLGQPLQGQQFKLDHCMFRKAYIARSTRHEGAFGHMFDRVLGQSIQLQFLFCLVNFALLRQEHYAMDTASIEHTEDTSHELFHCTSHHEAIVV